VLLTLLLALLVPDMLTLLVAELLAELLSVALAELLSVALAEVLAELLAELDAELVTVLDTVDDIVADIDDVAVLVSVAVTVVDADVISQPQNTPSICAWISRFRAPENLSHSASVSARMSNSWNTQLKLMS
jgi:hypothetical protein